jgi:transposase
MALIKRKPAKLAAVALANKTARIAWKLMISGERYDRNRAARSAKHSASACGAPVSGHGAISPTEAVGD